MWRVNSNRWITADIVTRWVDGAHINVGSGHDWASISRDDADAWLEIKGALGESAAIMSPSTQENVPRVCTIVEKGSWGSDATIQRGFPAAAPDGRSLCHVAISEPQQVAVSDERIHDVAATADDVCQFVPPYYG